MSYCPKCGALCAEGQTFCSGCGANLTQQNQPQYSQPQYSQPQYTQPQYTQPQYTQPQYTQPQYSQPQYYGQPQYAPGTPMTPELSMKWFKFIIYFQLFANCFFNVINAISALTGSMYGTEGESELVYSMVSGLRGVDTVFGMLLLAVAALALVTRFRLSGYHQNGPMLYHILMGAQIGISIFYLIATTVVISDSILGGYYEPDFTSTISSLVTTAAMLVCNIKYFNNRKHLFVN